MNKLSHPDRVFISLCFALLFLVGCALLWNKTHQNYPVNFYGLHRNELFLFFGCAAVYFSTLHMTSRYPSVMAIVKVVAMLFMIITVKCFCDMGVLTSAFPTEDHLIEKVDRLLGFHFLPVLIFMHYKAGSAIVNTLWCIYFSVLILTLVFPLGFSAVEKTTELYRFYISFLISLIVGYVICYFFPTLTSPAALYPHQYFTAMQLQSVHAYQLLHQHQPVNFDFVGSVVSFPSYHAIWIVFIVYFLWGYQKIRYPAVVYGVVAMATLVLTGWHYLFDVIGGIAVAFLAITVSNYLLRSRSHLWQQENTA